MKGNEKIIEKLNDLLADELTAANQYFLHAEMCANCGYERLYEKIRKRSITFLSQGCVLGELSPACNGFILIEKPGREFISHFLIGLHREAFSKEISGCQFWVTADGPGVSAGSSKSR